MFLQEPVGDVHPPPRNGQTPPHQTPPGSHPLPRRPLQRTVRILLECIPVGFFFLF